MQDGDDERAREISKMGYIYENAWLNIGAQAAAEVENLECEAGLFVDRHNFAKQNDLICTRVQRGDYDELCYLFAPKDGNHSLDNSALMSRGWIFQERLLSPRSIYFDEQLRWECTKLVASENYPNGFACDFLERPPFPIKGGRSTPFRIYNFLFDSNFIARQSGALPADIPGSLRYNWSSKYQCWMKLVEKYSLCSLTYETDRLLALSGLAKHFAKTFDDEYIAGLWRKDMFHQLLWRHATADWDTESDRDTRSDFSEDPLIVSKAYLGE
jgi:hypothetical protein